MTDFVSALFNPDLAFLRYALLAGILASVAFGIVGTYVVVRRISYIAGAIAHCVLGGIGAALYFREKWNIEWLDPMLGAVIAAMAAAILIGLVSLYARQREDTAIGALWAIGMAAGLLFIARTPGYIDPMIYLFGNILLITQTDVWVIAGLDVLVVAAALLFYNRFLGICFDEEFSTLRGVHVKIYYLFLLCLTALSVVLLVRVVGIVLVIALLTLPAAIAGAFSARLWQMMLLAVILCMFFTAVGLGISYTHDLPTGPTIIVFAGFVYLVTALLQHLIRPRFAESRGS